MTSPANEHNKPHAPTPAGIPFSPPPAHNPTDKTDIDKEVDQALGGVSIEELMAQSVNKGPAAPQLDPARPVRGGRPGARRHQERDDGINPDNIKKGRIAGIRGSNVLVDIGGKSQGICPIEQFDQDVAPAGGEAGAEQKKSVEVGQEYEFVFKGYDAREGLVILARKGAIQHGAWETLQVGDTVEAVVTGVNKGGLELKVGTTRAFMPAGQVDTKFHQDLSVFLNEKLTVRVAKVDREDHNIVLSRRAIVEEEEAKKGEQTWAELAVGQVREGIVRSVQPYGAFVDLGGVDGLLHVSAMSHQRTADPKKVVKEGDKLQVMITGVDKEKKRVSLSMKSLAKDPWDDVTHQFPIGTTVNGTVKKVVEFGAFVELSPGVEGLVHVSQLSMKRVNRPSEVVKEGQEVSAKILGIDLDKRRISLSISEAERDSKIASGELKPEEAPPAKSASGGASGGAAATGAGTAKPSNQPKKHLKGGL